MKKLVKTLTLPALVVFASASQAALYDITVDITGDITGGQSGTILGSATGTFDSTSGDMLFAGTIETVLPAFTVDTIFGTEGVVNGLTGSVTYTSCDPNGATDLCAFTALNTPQNVTFTTNTVDSSGNGIVTSVATNGTSTSNMTFTVTGTPAVSAVPVPAAAWLFGSALLGLGGVRRFKRRG